MTPGVHGSKLKSGFVLAEVLKLHAWWCLRPPPLFCNSCFLLPAQFSHHAITIHSQCQETSLICSLWLNQHQEINKYGWKILTYFTVTALRRRRRRRQLEVMKDSSAFKHCEYSEDTFKLFRQRTVPCLSHVAGDTLSPCVAAFFHLAKNMVNPLTWRSLGNGHVVFKRAPTLQLFLLNRFKTEFHRAIVWCRSIVHENVFKTTAYNLDWW